MSLSPSSLPVTAASLRGAAPRRSRLHAALLCAMLASATLQAAPARVGVYAFDASGLLSDIEVHTADGQVRQPDAFGNLALELPAGEHTLKVYRGGALLSELPLRTVEDEIAEIILNIQPDGSTRVVSESSHGGSGSNVPVADADAGPPGVLEGVVVSADDGKPVAGARIFVSGTPVDVSSDAQGRFRIELGAGEYALSVLAPSFGAMTVPGVLIEGEQTTQRQIELAPAELELPEYVVLEPYIQGSLAAFAEERRSSAAVTDVLGAEQISKAGDSDAAGALKRVTGLTLVDGKYVYVRGLGERYSSVLLNGAQIPSPDPTRRVVPLDLFPTDILEGVGIQKTYSADMPGEFGGGTIQLRTRNVPKAFFLRINAGWNYADGTTGEEGLRYAGGSEDWRGRDDGTRALPASIADATADGQVIRARSGFNPNGFTPQQIETFGDDLAGGYDVNLRGLGPSGSMALSTGNSFRFGEDGPVLGVLAAVRYSQDWDNRSEQRRNFQNSAAGLTLRDDVLVEYTERNIDVSAYAAAGLKWGENHDLGANLVIVRQTEDEARITSGSADNQELRRTRLQWIENELIARQLNGSHLFPALGELDLKWNLTDAQANRYEPNTREYRYDVQPDGSLQFSQLADSNSTVYANLVDDSRSWDAQLSWPWQFRDDSVVKLMAGYGRLERARTSGIRRFTYGFGRLTPLTLFNELSAERIFNDANIFPNGISLTETTTPSDTYQASQDLDHLFAGFDVDLAGKYRLTAGWRREQNQQQVSTRDIARPNNPPVLSTIDERDYLPAYAATWMINDSSQLRLGYSRTLSRPDFRELSPAPFLDPLLDAITIGNPNLRSAGLENIDLRYEYYFSPTESFSIALFRKTFTNPIEKQRIPGVGVLLELANALGAENRGVELDFYKSMDFVNRWSWLQQRSSWIPWSDLYLGVNYSYIDSTIELDPVQSVFNTNPQRQLEGQSPYVANVQIGYQHPAGKSDWTLLFNQFGERIVQVGISGQPDIFEQPFGQLDFVYKRSFDHGLSLRVRLRNLLDPAAQFRQGPEITRNYKKGRELGLSLEWRFD